VTFNIRKLFECVYSFLIKDEAARPPVFVEKKVWMWERIEAALMQPLLSTQDIISAIKRYHRAIAHLPVLQHTIDVVRLLQNQILFFEYQVKSFLN